MNNEHDYPVSTRMVRLVYNENAMVVPADKSNPSAFEPFYVPHMPMSQTCWLSGLIATFRHKHRRCLAALLMLDCQTGRWLEPLIPTQDCAKNGVTWTIRESDFENQPANARRRHLPERGGRGCRQHRQTHSGTRRFAHLPKDRETPTDEILLRAHGR